MNNDIIQKITDIFNRDYPTASDETYEFFYDVLNVLRNAKSDWIKIEDRLPEPRTSVLVCCNTYFSDSQVKVVKYLDKHSGFLTSCTVTHWMPLPNPPESEE